MAARYVAFAYRQLHSNNKKGFIYLLRPSPELWTVSLPHRTQILYAPDMSFITMKLGLSPGACVFEAGTGSGSFTHFLARTVARGPSPDYERGQLAEVWRGEGLARTPSALDVQASEYGGRVYSFEFHAERVEKARKEFSAHGLDSIVVLDHRNVCKDGFGISNRADAVFLDLPAPWEAVPFAKEVLRQDVSTRICCFSPCIEQVLRTVTSLSEHGFTDVTMYESLVRTHESLTNVAPLDSISHVVERIRQTEAKRESRRQMQIAHSRADRERRLAEQQDMETSEPHPQAPHCDGSLKRKADTTEEAAEAAPGMLAENERDTAAEMLYSAGFRQKVERRPMTQANVYSRPYAQMRGHTSYLTFATLLPRST